MARLTFLGAAQTVTGSQYLVEAGDAARAGGLRDVPGREGAAPAQLGGAALRSARGPGALVLTHTHLDHIGRVPRLVKQGFRGRIFCTPPTRELAEVLLEDAAHLQEEDADYLNRKGSRSTSPRCPSSTAPTWRRP